MQNYKDVKIIESDVFEEERVFLRRVILRRNTKN